MTSPIPTLNSRNDRRLLVAILLLGCICQVLWFPHPHRFDDMDEFGYLMCGPQVFEGLPPGYHYTFAGPEAWVGWVYIAAYSARYVVFPTAEEAAAPSLLRPYIAVNHAMWETYFDITILRLIYISISIILSLVAVATAFFYGRSRGGQVGALLLGGMAALTPVLVMHAPMAKSYSAAWSFSLIAAAMLGRASERPRAFWWSAILLGLAASSRVEMFAVLPLLLLLEVWPARTSTLQFLRRAVQYILAMVLTVMIVAPWSWTNLLGNLRAIATIRLGPSPGTPAQFSEILRDFAWENAMALPLAVFLTAVVAALLRRQKGRSAEWRWGAGIVALIACSSFLRTTGYGLRHQGPSFISLLLVLPMSVAALRQIAPRAIAIASTASLLVALLQSVIGGIAFQRAYVPDEATAWVNGHVPQGTTVYLTGTWNDPLPTPQSADAILSELMTPDAVRRKYQQGESRFNSNGGEVPRALSEQLLITERTPARRFYILGGRSEWVGPRFNVRPYRMSAVFWTQDPVPEFNKTGGVLIWRGSGPPPGMTLAPAATWLRGTVGTYVYVSPDVATRLKP
jgi:hypothetical protein